MIKSGTPLLIQVVAYDQRKETITPTKERPLQCLYALRVWRLYLFKHFQLLTDNQAVTYLLSKKHLSGREARWLDTLANFDMSITHKPGKDNVADPLSRALDTSPLPSPDDLETNASLGSVIGEFCQDDETKEQLFKTYHEDVYFKNIITKLEEDSRNAWKKRYFWSKERGLLLLEDPMWRLCIPKGSLRLKLLRMYHQSASSCHPGRERTYLRLRCYFYWPKLAKSVKQFVKSCDICQRSKGDKPMPNPLQPLPIPKQPWEDLSMDFIMGLPTSANGNNAILTFVDRLTKGEEGGGGGYHNLASIAGWPKGAKHGALWVGQWVLWFATHYLRMSFYACEKKCRYWKKIILQSVYSLSMVQ